MRVADGLAIRDADGEATGVRVAVLFDTFSNIGLFLEDHLVKTIKKVTNKSANRWDLFTPKSYHKAAKIVPLRPNAMVRLWAFQGSMTTNVITKQIDWTGLDRVVNAAQKNGKKLILVLTEQAGHCDDGHWKGKTWYAGGYKQAFNDLGNGLTPLSYLDYVKLIVARYKDIPAVAMWEPINEPNASDCVSETGYECYSHLSCSNEPAANNNSGESNKVTVTTP